MIVPFLDLRSAYHELQSEIGGAIARVCDSGWYIGGEEVLSFEHAYANYCEANHCVGVANGLDALHLALRALDVGPGDEVIVSSNTFIATWLAVSMVGATPVPVEPELATHNLDPELVRAAITSRTKVIMPTHLYGQPANLDPLVATARDYGLNVVEDAAQAHGARYKGKRLGAHGDIVAWSFYPGKNLGAMGDGGAVTTNSAEVADKIRMLGNYGSRTKYVNEMQGVNSRLDPLQAAILEVKLRHLDRWNERRSAIAAKYLDLLSGHNVTAPHVPAWAEPSWHLFVIQLQNREEVAQALQQAGVQTLIHYPVPPHRQQAYRSVGSSFDAFPIAERLAEQVLSLPIGPHQSGQQTEAVAQALMSAVG